MTPSEIRYRRLYSAALAAIMVTAPAVGDGSSPGDKAAILEVIDRLFANLAAQDRQAVRALQHPSGMMMSVRADTAQPANAKAGHDTAGGNVIIRTRSNAEALWSMNGEPQPYFERWISDPKVQIDGNLAHVWGQYDFWRAGAFSHCGVNSITLVKDKGAWTVVNTLWTVKTGTDDCPTQGDSPPTR